MLGRRSIPLVMVTVLAAAGLLAGAGDSSATRTRLTPAEEGALWDDMDEALVPQPSAPAPATKVPARSFFVVKRRGDYEAVVVECRGTCEQPACGALFRPGCSPSDSCARSALAIDIEFGDDAEAYAWLEEVAQEGS